jgi:acetyl esterase/lipase
MRERTVVPAFPATALAAATIGAVLLLVLGGVSTAADKDTLAESAHQFAIFVMTGQADSEPNYTPEMKAAFPESKVQEFRAALQLQNGSFKSVGSAWHEDSVQGYERYRVPISFENAVIDFRVVFDQESRIAGMFFVEHTEPPDREASAPGTESEIMVGEAGNGLPGTLLIPTGDGPFPAVVLVHGSGPNDRDETAGPNKPFRDIAWGLCERGIASLRYDKRSLVRPGDLVNMGETLTVQHEVVDDALEALSLLKNRSEIDAAQIFVAGHSLGGNIAPRIAQQAESAAGVIILAGFTLPLPEKTLEQSRYIAAFDGIVTTQEKDNIDGVAESVTTIRSGVNGESVPAGYYLGAPIGYYRDLEAVDGPALMASLNIPCLVLQGSRDYQVTLEDYALWEKSLRGKGNACLRVFDGLDHLFRKGEGPSGPSDYDTNKPVSPEVIECMAGWILTGSCSE